MLVEVCANSLESALNAEKAGADRIELCSELAVGGITPSYGVLKEVADKISIPVRVLIRPRSGDFSYSDAEFEIMKKNVLLCKEIGFNGVVLGMLQTDFAPDEQRFLEIAEISDGLHITFHRAFDWVLDPFSSLKRIENLGVDTILTSGQKPTALEGIELLYDLKGKSTNTMIMPGSGINVSNAHQFKERGFKAIHLSATKMKQKLHKDPKVGMNSPRMLSDNSVLISDLEIIQEVVKAVK
jgi:copper homeostasis protein